jgi:hypothetical protein
VQCTAHPAVCFVMAGSVLDQSETARVWWVAAVMVAAAAAVHLDVRSLSSMLPHPGGQQMRLYQGQFVTRSFSEMPMLLQDAAVLLHNCGS